MSVSLEGVKMAEKITVDIVDGLEFELEVDGLYRWDPPALPHGAEGPWDSTHRVGGNAARRNDGLDWGNSFRLSLFSQVESNPTSTSLRH
jgi:hypothetical protein